MQHKNKTTLPTELSSEELLEALNNAPKDEEEPLNYINDILAFLAHYGIKPGAHPVDKRILFDLYRQWAEMPIGRNAFAQQLGKYLFVSRDQYRSYYNINLSAFKLSAKSLTLFGKKYDRLKSPTLKRHFNYFLDSYKIKPGRTWIPGFAVHHLYTEWCTKASQRKAIGYTTFAQFLNIHFKNKRNGASSGRVYAFSDNIKDHINEETIKKLKEERKSKSKNKKSGSKTSSKS